MRTLADAWGWYTAVATNANRLNHIAELWDELPWGTTEQEWVGRLERDNVLRHVESRHMRGDAHRAAEGLDDLAVLVLFSVFEAIVRDWVEEQVRPEIESLRHRTLKKAGEDVLDAVRQGSFFRLLEPYKAGADANLVEQVNQIRRYRNWVAHGKHPDKQPDALVTPKVAFERLSTFLELLRESPRSANLKPSGNAP
jgi:hypothetical protein